MDVFDLVAKLSLDTKEYENELKGAESKASSFGSGLGGKLASGLGAVTKVAAGAVTAAAAGVTAITKSAVDSFGEYEQLKGGIETLFGDSAQKVLQDSQKAFADAGMSQNQYMETSIQSAAALINSLGGDQAKAADLMNTSITDMADNVNKMGTDMEAVQNAYRGFSRGNFTMLDNLALGFAGTKEGMQELLAQAKEFSGVDYNIDSYADIVEAIHVVQGEMGISGRTAEEAAEIIARTGRSSEEVFEQLGTTAKEGTTTIQGSLSQLGAAWENLIAGLANPDANLGDLINNVVTSAETALNNLLPAVEKALGGIAGLIERIAPIIGAKLPGLVSMILPKLLKAITSLINAAVDAIPALLKVIDKVLPSLIIAATNLIRGLVDALPGLMQILAAQIPTIINLLMNTILSVLPMLVEVGLQIIVTIANGISESLPTMIPTIVSVILQIIQILIDNAPMLIDAGITLITALIEGIVSALPMLMEKGPEIILKLLEAIVQNAPKILEAGLTLIQNFVQGIINNLPQIVETAVMIIMSLITGLVQAIPEVIGTSLQIIGAIMDTFASIDWLQVGSDIIAGIIAGIARGAGALVDAVKEAAKKALDAAKSFLGIKSPSRVFRDSVGKMIDMGLAEGIEGNTGYVDDAMKDLNDATSLDFSQPQFQFAGGYGIMDSGSSAVSEGGYEDVVTAISDALMNMQLVVNIGNRPIEAMITTAQQKTNYRSGGR